MNEPGQSFSRFITALLLGLVGVSLVLVMGSLYGVLGTSMTQEFTVGLKAERNELDAALRDRFHLIESRLKEISLDNTLRVSLMLGVTRQVREALEKNLPYLPGVSLYLLETASNTFIPALTGPGTGMETAFRRLAKENRAGRKPFMEIGDDRILSVFSIPVRRKNESLGTLFMLYDLSRDRPFRARFLNTGRLLIPAGGRFVDLVTMAPVVLRDPGDTLPENPILGPGSAVRPNETSIPLNAFPGLRYAASVEDLQQKKRNLVFKLAILSVSVFALALIVAYILVLRTVAPLENLARQAETLARDPGRRFLEIEGLLFREFRTLGRAFNDLLSGLIRAREKERKAKDFLHAIINTMADPIFVRDEEHRWIILNDAFCELIGAPKESLIGKKCTDFLPPDEAALFQETDEILLKTGKTFTYENKLTDVRGKTHVLLTKKNLLVNPDTGEAFFVGVDRDITREKKMEAELEGHRDRLTEMVSEKTSELMATNERLVQEIEERKRIEKDRQNMERRLRRAQKMEAIGTLAGGVAHDLNNILAGIVAYPELLLIDLPEESPLRKPIQTIKRSGEKAAAIVQDLLTLSRRGVSADEPIDVNRVVVEYLESPEWERLCGDYPDLRIDTDLAPDLMPILGSSLHLFKSVMNMACNAAEAMPDGGRLRISTENRYVDCPIGGYESVREGDYVTLTITDTGTGIEAEDIDRIFEPFFTRKQMGRSGTGLGMAVVWGTVKDHKGYIDVSSRIGEGTSITLYFPVARNLPAGPADPEPLLDVTGNGETVLVVDDVAEQREIAKAMVGRLGYRVETAESGEAAVTYLARNRADLIVLDMIMAPGMDGLETYREILQVAPGQPAIITSGFSESDRVRELQGLGAGAYVRKPYDLEKIGKAIHAELVRRRPPGPVDPAPGARVDSPPAP